MCLNLSRRRDRPDGQEKQSSNHSTPEPTKGLTLKEGTNFNPKASSRARQRRIHPAAPRTDLSHLMAQWNDHLALGDTKHREANSHPSQKHINRMEHLCKNYATFLGDSYSTATLGCTAVLQQWRGTVKQHQGTQEGISHSQPHSSTSPGNNNHLKCKHNGQRPQGRRSKHFRGAWAV